MAYNDIGPVPSAKEDSDLTVRIGVPKWLKTVWSTTVGCWFKHDDIYSAFFKILGGLILAPIAGGATIAAYNGSVSFILTQVLVTIGLLGIVGMATMDDGPTAKQTFWRWITTTIVWYAASVIGIVEIYIIRAMIM